MLPSEKMLKMAEAGEKFAIHFPEVSGYVEFMKDTFPELVLKSMWAKFGAQTCVFVLDDLSIKAFNKDATDTASDSPPTRILKPRSFIEATLPHLVIKEASWLYFYNNDRLAKLKRADRVIVNGPFNDVHVVDAPGVIVGLRAEFKDGSWYQEVLITGTKDTDVVPEAFLKYNTEHPANKDEADFLNKEKGNVRERPARKIYK